MVRKNRDRHWDFNIHTHIIRQEPKKVLGCIHQKDCFENFIF